MGKYRHLLNSDVIKLLAYDAFKKHGSLKKLKHELLLRGITKKDVSIVRGTISTLLDKLEEELPNE